MHLYHFCGRWRVDGQDDLASAGPIKRHIRYSRRHGGTPSAEELATVGGATGKILDHEIQNR
jgi:hypothetical protein